MIIIDNKLISDEIVEKQFVCDLANCKGACCEDGDAGAPLEKNELALVNEVYEKVKPFLTIDSVKEIESKGLYVYHTEFGWVTPTLPSDHEICVYAIRNKDGIIKCAFEKAYNEGLISWKKPLSCHLYPIKIKKDRQGEYDRVNYEPREQLCSPGCALGERLKVPVYKFLKEALIRKYGEEFYDALDNVAREYYPESIK